MDLFNAVMRALPLVADLDLTDEQRIAFNGALAKAQRKSRTIQNVKQGNINYGKRWTESEDEIIYKAMLIGCQMEDLRKYMKRSEKGFAEHVQKVMYNRNMLKVSSNNELEKAALKNLEEFVLPRHKIS